MNEKYWKNALDRNEADSVGHSMGKTRRKAQGEENTTHTLSLQINNPQKHVPSPTPNFPTLLFPNVSLPCIHY